MLKALIKRFLEVQWTLETKFLLVATEVLPEIFSKVVKAKTLLAQGKAKNASQASQLAGISRSAFYKYKDFVFSYERHMSDNIITFNITLIDSPGNLSLLLSDLYSWGVNVLTINQSIPTDGVAPVSISMRTNDVKITDSELTEKILSVEGVVSAKQVSGR